MQCFRVPSTLSTPYALRFISSATIYGRTYTVNEQSRILDKLNQSPVEELSQYDISQSRVKKIFDWRSKKNHFAQLDDCLQLDGFGEKILNKFYDSILGGKLKTVERKMSSVVTPRIPEELKKQIQSCVAVNVCFNNISWSKIGIQDEKQLAVLDWQHFPIENKKYQLTELLEIALKISRLIPEADAYVMENPNRPPTMMSNINANKISVEKAQLNAMLGALLMNRKTDDGASNLFFLKQFAAAKLFNTFVGNEKTSNKSVVLNLLGEDESSGWTDIASVLQMNRLQASQDVREHYLSSDNIEKEFIGQSLLVGLAFVKLALMKINCD